MHSFVRQSSHAQSLDTGTNTTQECSHPNAPTVSVLGVGRRTESSNTNGLCPLFEEYFGIRIIGIVP